MPHDVYQRAVDCPYRETFYPFGHPVLVESNDRRALECAQSTFGHWPALSVPGPVVRVRLLLDPSITTAPPWPEPIYRGLDDLLGISCGSCFAFADLQRMYGQAHFSDALLSDPEFFRWVFLYALVHIPLQQHFFTLIHAACVVRGGRGFCLSGPSSAGKTTLAYYCGRHGYDVLAEDMVAVDRTGPLRLRGSAHVLHFTADSAGLFPELVQYPVTLARNRKDCLLVPAQELGVRWLSECVPGGLLFLDRGGCHGLERLAAEKVVEDLCDQFQANKPEILAADRQTLERLVACGAYRLGYTTLEEALELLNRL